MKKFISREKLSKKARKELDRQARTVWQRSPVTRCPEASGAYNRSRAKSRLKRQLAREGV